MEVLLEMQCKSYEICQSGWGMGRSKKSGSSCREPEVVSAVMAASVMARSRSGVVLVTKRTPAEHTA